MRRLRGPAGLTATALIGVAVVVLAVAVRATADDPDARVAFAEYLAAKEAADTAAQSAETARNLIPTLEPQDHAQAHEVAAGAERVAQEATDHAERLKGLWGSKWKRGGLKP